MDASEQYAPQSQGNLCFDHPLDVFCLATVRIDFLKLLSERCRFCPFESLATGSWDWHRDAHCSVMNRDAIISGGLSNLPQNLRQIEADS